jgi:hypothetical protein
MMLGAPISVGQLLFWNLLPVTLGNIVAGTVLTGVALSVAFPIATAPAVNKVQPLTAEPNEQQTAFVAAAGLH